MNVGNKCIQVIFQQNTYIVCITSAVARAVFTSAVYSVRMKLRGFMVKNMSIHA